METIRCWPDSEQERHCSCVQGGHRKMRNLRNLATRTAGLSLLETMIAAGIASTIVAAFLTATITLQRSFAATQAYSISKRDQMRLTDYLALDLRRALTVQTATS